MDKRETTSKTRRPFAKLFETADLGQILIMREEGDNGPQIKLTVDPAIEGVETVDLCVGFPNNEIGERAAATALQNIDLDAAVALAYQALSPLQAANAALEKEDANN